MLWIAHSWAGAFAWQTSGPEFVPSLQKEEEKEGEGESLPLTLAVGYRRDERDLREPEGDGVRPALCIFHSKIRKPNQGQ